MANRRPSQGPTRLTRSAARAGSAAVNAAANPAPSGPIRHGGRPHRHERAQEISQTKSLASDNRAGNPTSPGPGPVGRPRRASSQAAPPSRHGIDSREVGDGEPDRTRVVELFRRDNTTRAFMVTGIDQTPHLHIHSIGADSPRVKVTVNEPLASEQADRLHDALRTELTNALRTEMRTELRAALRAEQPRELVFNVAAEGDAGSRARVRGILRRLAVTEIVLGVGGIFLAWLLTRMRKELGLLLQAVDDLQKE